MSRLVRDDRKATVTQVNTRYTQGMQKIISEHTTRRTLKQMCHSSRRPHRVPLLSANNRTRRLQFTHAHQNWTIEDWKNIAWSDESRFLLRHSDVGSLLIILLFIKSQYTVFAHLIVLHFLFYCTFYSYLSFFTIYMLLLLLYHFYLFYSFALSTDRT